MSTCQAANTSDISIENKTCICLWTNTLYISIDNNIRICQAASTSDISIETKHIPTKRLTHLRSA